jgi:hypothetical protein
VVALRVGRWCGRGCRYLIVCLVRLVFLIRPAGFSFGIHVVLHTMGIGVILHQMRGHASAIT